MSAILAELAQRSLDMRTAVRLAAQQVLHTQVELAKGMSSMCNSTGC